MAAQPALVSASDYLRLEAQAESRHEFVAGIVYQMAGASRNHAVITRNLHGILYRLLGDAPCQNLDQDTKVWIAQANTFYYPDATISCPPNFVDPSSGVIDNPKVVVEVLSPSTAGLDRGPKFADYRELESLRDFVLIDSQVQSVEVFSLERDEWLVRTFRTGRAFIPSVGVELDLTELYRHVPMER